MDQNKEYLALKVAEVVELLEILGFFGEPGEVTIVPTAGDYIPGACSGLKDHEAPVTTRENISADRVLRSDSRQGSPYSEGVNQGGGVVISNTIGNGASSPVLSTSPTTDHSVSQADLLLQGQGESECGCKERFRVVDTLSQVLEWTRHPAKECRFSIGNRCIQDWLGSTLRGSENRGISVTSGAVPPY